jgi:hypothetical protein
MEKHRMNLANDLKNLRFGANQWGEYGYIDWL